MQSGFLFYQASKKVGKLQRKKWTPHHSKSEGRLKVEGWINFLKALIDQGSIVYISVVGCKGPFHYYLYPHAL